MTGDVKYHTAEQADHRRQHANPRGGRDRLEIQTAPRPDGAEPRLSGELTLATAGRFLDELIEADQPP